MEPKIDLSALQDGKLYLIAICGNKFAYLAEDPESSQWLVHEAINTKFPILVRRMLAEAKLTDAPIVNG